MHFFLVSLLSLVLILSCSSGGDDEGVVPKPDTKKSLKFVERELVDPTPGSGDLFGSYVYGFSNGNIIVADPFDSSVVSFNGAFHLYSSNGDLIKSYYGDDLNDSLSASGASGNIHELANGNAVLISSEDNVAGVSSAGSVILVDTKSGNIIKTIYGDNYEDKLGLKGVLVLNNGNFVIMSPDDNVMGISDAGSARLINGETGDEIAVYHGDNSNDDFGRGGIALTNGHFVLGSRLDNIGGLSNAGSVKLINGETGVEITTINGDNTNDRYPNQTGGNRLDEGLLALKNGNFVIAAVDDDIGGVVDVGSVRLVNGKTGAVITTFSGVVAGDEVGLSLNEVSDTSFVIISKRQSVAGMSDAGVVQLINSSTGAQIGSISGDNAGDELGREGIVTFDGNILAIVSPYDEVGGVTEVGSVKFMDSLSFSLLFSKDGISEEGYYGNGGIKQLSNGNFVISSPETSVNSLSYNGVLEIINQTNGSVITSISGTSNNANIGSSGVEVIGNDRIVIASKDDNSNLISVGSIQVIDGESGILLLRVEGESANDQITNNGIEVFFESYIVGFSRFEDGDGVNDTGSIKLIDGNNASVLKIIGGQVQDDFISINTAKTNDQNSLILGTPRYDNSAGHDSGMVRLFTFE